MKFTKFTPVVAVATALLFAGCASTRTQQTAGEQIDDGAISAKVKAALIADPAAEARHINVETRRGVVQLNGFVETDKGRTQATRLAREVEGVRSVETNLTLKDQTRSLGEVVDDGTITGKVKAALIDSPVTKAYEIKVETNDGRVMLGGFVNSPAVRQEAGRLAGLVGGVVSVDNNLDVKK
ncbi:MAG: BON domain-containing protein [Gammaproteobacteria bacterium]|nr:BON domain-containing protein [Gammaproteobacteria bacterium]